MVTVKDIDRDDITGYLGNKLFMIATAYDLAVKNNDELILPRFEFENLFQDSFFSVIDKEQIKQENEYNEPFFHYQQIPYQKNLNLNGYFQSHKYFNKKLIQTKFQFNKILVDIILDTKVPKLGITYEKLFLENRVVGIHRRLGDFIQLSNHHPVLSNEYYKSAFNYFENADYFLFTSNDIMWCKEVFRGNKFLFSETKQEKTQGNSSAAFDLCLLSMCNDNIIANSSFSWWSAFLNSNDDKKVVCPGTKINPWFGPALSQHDTKDLYPTDWIKL